MWPAHVYDRPVLIPEPNNDKSLGEIYLSGIGWTNDLPAEAEKTSLTHIVNCAGSFLRANHYKTDISTTKLKYIELDLVDVSFQPLDGYVDSTYNFINEHIKDPNAKILIHCFYGQSRSVTILCYYLMKKYNWTYDTSINYVKQYRPIASPNFGFENYLKSLKN